MSVCHVHVWCPWSPEEGVGSLGAELQMVMSYHVSVGNKHGSSARTSDLNHRHNSSAPLDKFLSSELIFIT